MASIPASAIVNVTPGVEAAGGTALELNGVVLTHSSRVPIGSVLSFPSLTAVGTYFGQSSDEYSFASVYFAGYDDSDVKPGALLFSQYPAGNVGAYLRGGALGLTLAQLQAITSGTLIVTIDGVTKTASSINLSAATSLSNAATIIDTALAATGPVGAVVTGSISTTTLTVTAVASGALAVGQILSGSGITAGTKITALGTGTGGTGTYTVGTSQTAASTTVTARAQAVTYDSVSGAFVVTSGTTGAASTISYATGTLATTFKLTAATGAVTSQGDVAGVPATNMAAIKAVTQNWASFATIFEPVTADKVLFAGWSNTQANRFAYAMWDTDVTAVSSDPSATAGYLIDQAGYSGVIPLYAPVNTFKAAAFAMGWAASLNFAVTNGRATLAFRTQSGLPADVTNETYAANLLANGYNFYGAYATANDQFVFAYDGQVSGPFLWADSYVNQIQLNSALQVALLSLLVSAGSVPYNPSGYAQIEAACLDPINAALNFGTIRAGVVLSASQIAQVNADAGLRIADTLQQRGWYLQVKDPGATVRAARGSPASKLWYVDGQSVQSIDLASVQVQ